ncbi:phenylalanyl-tRNA synthetase beta chain [Mycoplasma haemofelis str. Langford 1]|uniref:Phenylalanyl-tRNA synthetase beta chain n=1 Tax=Mycoplasma haemofelis (strain Langford 1) TaxID=941640 RepID=E8ZK47_MYCHL|nr:phenylalanine--tRNA ligase subunit beta [Mycoplasma haemofelis]CBY93518.1 phenylalanyl-tRNA synthetase beta chain [Mycoplasma haemofelis str. Langford 1]
MIISRNLISHFLPRIQDYSIEQITSALFKSGIEVEAVDEIKAPNGVVYGLIESFEKVEGSDKLNFCKVLIPSEGKVRDIVCGASNVRNNLKVVVALPGASLLGGKVKIQERKVFGKLSRGMICAYGELHEFKLIGSNFPKGIIELPDDFDINRPFSLSHICLDDVVLDLSIPTNRNDLHCAWGIAEELAKNLGCPHEEGDVPNISDWNLKTLLVVNNFSVSDPSINEALYCYACFNEIPNRSLDTGNSLTFREKSNYFSLLLNRYLQGIDIPELEGRRIPIDWRRILEFLCISCELKESLISRLKNYSFSFEEDFVIPPRWRDDIQDQKDFAEEVARFMDIGDLEERPPVTYLSLPDNKGIFELLRIKSFLRSRGFFECSSFNLQDGNLVRNSFHLWGEDTHTVENPISSDRVSYRRHGLYELLSVLEFNKDDGMEMHPVFEITYNPNGNEEVLNVLIPAVSESFPMCSTVISGNIFDLQSYLKRVFLLIDKRIEFKLCHENKEPFWGVNLMHIMDGDTILGYVGYLKTKLPEKVVGASVLLSREGSKISRVSRERGKFPSSTRDISILVKPDFKGLQELMHSWSPPFLEDVKLLERYEDKGSISYLFRFTFRSHEKTLTKEDIDNSMSLIYKCIESKGLMVR